MHFVLFAAAILTSSLLLTAQQPAPRPRPRPTEPAQPSRPAPAGVLVMSTDAVCAVAIDGESVGKLSPGEARRLTLQPGEHVIYAASDEDPGISYSGTVSVAAGAQKALVIALRESLERTRAARKAANENPPASLLLMVDAEASVSVDGQDVGLVRMNVPHVVPVSLGKHVVVARARGGATVQTIVDVRTASQELVTLPVQSEIARRARGSVDAVTSAPPVAAGGLPSATNLRSPDVIFVPTPDAVVDVMLRVARVTSRDVVYDLGSGDGKIVIAAARLGARSVGVEIDPRLIARSHENARVAGVANHARFVLGDIFDPALKIGDATVVMLYLLPSLNAKLLPTLRAQLNPGARIVSHEFDMGDWKPDRIVDVDGRRVFLWTVR